MTEVQEEKKDEFAEQDTRAAGFQAKNPPMNEVLIAKTLAASITAFPEPMKLGLILDAMNMTSKAALLKAFTPEQLDEFRIMASLNRSLQHAEKKEIGFSDAYAVPWRINEFEYEKYVARWMLNVQIDWILDPRQGEDADLYDREQGFTQKQRFYELRHTYSALTYHDILGAFLDWAVPKIDELAAVCAALLSPNAQKIFEKMVLDAQAPQGKN